MRLHQQQQQHITSLVVHHSVPRLILPSISPFNSTLSYTRTHLRTHIFVYLLHFTVLSFHAASFILLRPPYKILSFSLSDKLGVELQWSYTTVCVCILVERESAPLSFLKYLKIYLCVLCMCTALMSPVNVIGNMFTSCMALTSSLSSFDSVCVRACWCLSIPAVQCNYYKYIYSTIVLQYKFEVSVLISPFHDISTPHFRRKFCVFYSTIII